jgi:hypothetical protein
VVAAVAFAAVRAVAPPSAFPLPLGAASAAAVAIAEAEVGVAFPALLAAVAFARAAYCDSLDSCPRLGWFHWCLDFGS